MTAIVGIAKDGKVWMGADSRCAWGDSHVHTLKQNKVFVNGACLLGVCGDTRFLNLLQHELYIPDPDENQDAFEYIIRKFIPSMRNCLKDAGYAEKDKEKESGGTALVGVNGRLFMIADDYSVNEHGEDYLAAGCGLEYCLGSLYNSEGEEPEARILRALATAAAFDPFVAPPFVVKSI